MSNKRKGRTGGRAVQPTPRLLADRLAEAAQLARRKQWDEAHDLLADLSRRYPNRPEVLAARVNLAVETQDTQAYQAAGERLLQLMPNDPDLALGLAHAYVANTHPALALRAFQRFLDRWPDDPRAAETRQLAAGLETTLREILPGLGLEG
ncbi:MAG TPA: hypothetical protein VHB98_00905, partial [Chloroflexota bacterium]|nr:hypothetical protein [Chloroflexota bacterium]